MSDRRQWQMEQGYLETRDEIPWATRESTPVERILDLSFGASSTKQESGSAHACTDSGRHLRKLASAAMATIRNVSQTVDMCLYCSLRDGCDLDECLLDTMASNLGIGDQ